MSDASRHPPTTQHPHAADSDEALVCRIRAGNHAAFGAFYDRHARRVLALLVTMVGCKSDAEDILQKVFWQVWTAASRYDAERSSAVAWLMLLARSRALDHLRARPRHETEALPEAAVEQTILIERLESEQLTRNALAALPDEQRRAIGLSFYCGLSHEEIAYHSNMPLGTVKTRIRRGMLRLREILNGREV